MKKIKLKNIRLILGVVLCMLGGTIYSAEANQSQDLPPEISMSNIGKIFDYLSKKQITIGNYIKKMEQDSKKLYNIYQNNLQPQVIEPFMQRMNNMQEQLDSIKAYFSGTKSN